MSCRNAIIILMINLLIHIILLLNILTLFIIIYTYRHTHACMFSCSGFAAILAQSVLAWAEVPPSVVAWRAWADVWSSPPLGGSIAWFPNNSGTQGNGCISTSTVYCLV